MRSIKPLITLSTLIALLALFAASSGIFWQGGGEHYSFVSLSGRTVDIWGGEGIYKLDAVAGASQEIAQDAVTLIIGIPLLLFGIILAARGSLRGRILLADTLGYFLYTYTSMSMLTTYNRLFLLYVALMSLSIFAFVIALMSIDATTLSSHFSLNFPRRTIATYSIFLGVMLLLLWLKLIISSLLEGTAPEALYSYTTLVIQALDLGIIAPTAILTGFLLFRRSPFGYLLCSIVLVLGFTMGAALIAMIVGQMLAGVPVDLLTSLVFVLLALFDAALAIWMFRSIRETPTPPQPTTPMSLRAEAITYIIGTH